MHIKLNWVVFYSCQCSYVFIWCSFVFVVVGSCKTYLPTLKTKARVEEMSWLKRKVIKCRCRSMYFSSALSSLWDGGPCQHLLKFSLNNSWIFIDGRHLCFAECHSAKCLSNKQSYPILPSTNDSGLIKRIRSTTTRFMSFYRYHVTILTVSSGQSWARWTCIQSRVRRADPLTLIAVETIFFRVTGMREMKGNERIRGGEVPWPFVRFVFCCAVSSRRQTYLMLKT